MANPNPKCERLPRIAVIGLFQGGKSLLINAALGGAVVPVGKFGLRTTPCRIRCRYGEVNRAVVCLDGESPRAFNIHSFHSYVERPEHVRNLEAVDFYYCHPILRQIELFDTPGIDFSEQDDESALSAARDADAVVLVVQQSLPAASAAFTKLSTCLHDKPWGLVLNCGRAGPHLENPDSPAAIEVENHCIQQLLEAGLQTPLFTQRMGVRTLTYYTAVPSDLQRSVGFSEEHQGDLQEDEISVRSWRENLFLLGNAWLNHRLEDVRQRILKLMVNQKWDNPIFKFEPETRTFSSRVGYDGWDYKVTGNFRIESMAGYDRVLLHEFWCKEQWVIDWLAAQNDWQSWKL